MLDRGMDEWTLYCYGPNRPDKYKVHMQINPYTREKLHSSLYTALHLTPSLEELVLIKMPKLETCSCISSRDLNSCLRVLVIKNCTALKVFDLFGNDHNFKIEQKSWLPRLCELIIHNCPLLLVPHPLPSSSTISRISMSGILGFPRIEALSCGSLTIGKDPEKEHSSDGECDLDVGRYDWCSDELSVLDEKILASHNPRFLTHLMIGYCEELSFKGLSELVSLKTLRIIECPVLSGFDVPPEHTPEDLTAANCNALQCLVYLEIDSCGIAWEWLSLILQHAPALTRLDLRRCPKLGYLQLNSCTALEKLKVYACESLGTLDVLQSPSLAKMKVEEVPNLKSLQLHSCTTLQKLVIGRAPVCMLEGLQSLKKLLVYSNQHLKSLQLHSCTALEELKILSCTSLSTLEGFQSLGSLGHLYLLECPGLHSCLEGLPVQDYKLCPRLEFLEISDFSFLTTSFCTQLTSLQRLVFSGSVKETPAGLTDEQERGLLLLGSLTELRFWIYTYLRNLPAGLHRLRSLRVLHISCCPSISRLPDLPPSLEELRIFHCSEELVGQSKSLASSKLKVNINLRYVN